MRHRSQIGDCRMALCIQAQWYSQRIGAVPEDIAFDNFPYTYILILIVVDELKQ
jgi:hypothetical protein